MTPEELDKMLRAMPTEHLNYALSHLEFLAQGTRFNDDMPLPLALEALAVYLRSLGAEPMFDFSQ